MDTREDILNRLVAIAATIDGISQTGRNIPVMTAANRPAIIIMDGGEERPAEDNKRDGRAAHKLIMRPVIVVAVSDSAETVGTLLNGFRAAILKAVLYDSPLSGLTGENGAVRYIGCETTAEKGQRVEADMSLTIELTYVLHPNKL
jgi:hypothetical protein